MTDILHRICALLVYLKVKDILPIAISLVALFVSLRDRRPRLMLRVRKGKWCTLGGSMSNNVLLGGIVEVNNPSARANAIRNYEFFCKRNHGGAWERMESEHYRLTSEGETTGECNVTPLTIPPYSGAALHVMAFTAPPRPSEMDVKVEVEDLFGKRYRLEVKATA